MSCISPECPIFEPKIFSMDTSFIINHLGEEHEKYFNSVSPPVIQTSNFCYPDVEKMRHALLNEYSEHVYTRGNNPTVNILRQKLAALEKTEDCLVTSSGCAAISLAVVPFLKTGDHAICVRNPYSWTEKLFTGILTPFNIEHTFIDGSSVQNFQTAVKPNTRLIYLESPASWTFEVQDIAAICRLAKEKGIITVIDNSYNTPLFQQPATMGADLVVHSATKYLSGHSDVVAGVICGSREKIRYIFDNHFMTFGNILSPHDAWLFIRGLRTLPLRLEKSSSNAAALISFLGNHPKVERIFYPFHHSHPQYELARKQLSGCSGLFTVQFRTASLSNIGDFCSRLKGFLLAVSWGGYESLVFPAIALYDPDDSAEHRLPWNMVRLYAGIEDPEFLVNGMKTAMEVL